MPEGPECRRVTDKLRELLKGKLMLWIEFVQNNTMKYRNETEPLWQQYEPLFPLTCLDVICRGKQIFFFLEQGVCLFGGLGMEGHWYRFEDPQLAEDYLNGKSAAGKPHPMFCLHFGKVAKSTTECISCDVNISEIQVWYDDSRSFGNFSIGTWTQAFEKMKTIGTDWLATGHPWSDIHPDIELPPFFYDEVTLDLFQNKIKEKIRRSRKPSTRLLCGFIAENDYLSGVGNYLKSEILYRAQLHPGRTLDSLTDDEIAILHQVTLETISQAYDCGGLTHGTFLDPDMEKGMFPIYVYKREGQTDENDYVIQYSKEFDGRGTFFVPEMQC